MVENNKNDLFEMIPVAKNVTILRSSSEQNIHTKHKPLTAPPPSQSCAGPPEPALPRAQVVNVEMCSERSWIVGAGLPTA